MMYHEAAVLVEDVVGEDELGNEILEYVEIPLGPVRLTEWTAEDVSVYGREITKGSRKVLLKPILDSWEGINYITINQEQYEILDIKIGHRWIILVIRGYRL